MRKINIKDIKDITKDCLTKACIYFSVITLGITSIATFLNLYLHPDTYLMLALASLGAGIAAQIFKVKKLPATGRHIAFFILLYLDFWLVVIPLSQYTATANSTLYLSLAFIVIYFVFLGIYMATRAVINSVRNKKSDYARQFENIE